MTAKVKVKVTGKRHSRMVDGKVVHHETGSMLTVSLNEYTAFKGRLVLVEEDDVPKQKPAKKTKAEGEGAGDAGGEA